jgi:hypothetical protein
MPGDVERDGAVDVEVGENDERCADGERDDGAVE